MDADPLARARTFDLIFQRYGWTRDYLLNDPLDRRGRPFLDYCSFQETLKVVVEGVNRDRLQHDRDLATHGYWHYMVAPKGPDTEMPTLAQWFGEWNVGDGESSQPAADVDPVEMFHRLYGPFLAPKGD